MLPRLRLLRRLRLRDNLIDAFESRKLKLEHAEGEEREQLLLDMQRIAKKLGHLKGWPYNRRVFWDDDAGIWKYRISADERSFVSYLLEPLATGRVLDLGCGSFSYTSPSIGLDLSFRMLKERGSGVQADLEGTLPFKDSSFDTITLVFILNYVKNLEKLVPELARVLKPTGRLLILQSNVPISSTHSIHEKHSIEDLPKKLIPLLQQHFKLKKKNYSYNKKSLLLVTATPVSSRLPSSRT